MNAVILRIVNRGHLREGKRADVTVFDAARVIDRATFENPPRGPAGNEYVIVNGAPVPEKGGHAGSRTGKILRKDGPRS